MKKLNQLWFLTTENLTFGNPYIQDNEINPLLINQNSALRVIEYNNSHKGIIDEEFLKWALKNNIEYEVVRWFILEYSKQKKAKYDSLIKALYKKFTIYCDESNNAVKFRFKDDKGETKTPWYNDFTLAGIVCDDTCNLNIESLFDEFKLQKNVIDAKLKHIAQYNGESPDRFQDILKSESVHILLKTLLETDGLYIHWSTVCLWYFALVDLVDSVLEIPLFSDEAKNVLYKYALEDACFFSILSTYNYPNIKSEEVKEFCTELIHWIESIEPKNSVEDFLIECIRQGIKSSRRMNNLLYIQDNDTDSLIDSFVANYAMRLAAFPNSRLTFDECGIVQENIEKYVKIYCSEKTPQYNFVKSDSSKWLQLADMISGINGALMAFINVHDMNEINRILTSFNELQTKNLKDFMLLRQKSSRYCIYFDNMSTNYDQIIKIKNIMQIEGIQE